MRSDCHDPGLQLRLDLLPVTAQPPLRETLREYVDARLAVYAKLPDFTAAKVEMDRASALQKPQRCPRLP